MLFKGFCFKIVATLTVTWQLGEGLVKMSLSTTWGTVACLLRQKRCVVEQNSVFLSEVICSYKSK